MEELVRITLIGLFFGTFGTTLGGIIGIVFKSTSKKFLSFILALASGLMMAIVCFDLIPEALEITNIPNTIIGILLGIIIMIFCNVIVEKKLKRKTSSEVNTMLKTGIIVSLGLAIHNFPEGLAIGSGMEASFKLGLNLAIAICLHDIPEGISMAVPMRAGGVSKTKIIIYIILSGITTGIGAFFGAVVGKISLAIIGICLSFAAGAMLYIVSGELTPEANNLYRGKMTALGNILGILLGIFATLN
jgi:ZIP family zinc transporter